jgi:hypothetical protein
VLSLQPVEKSQVFMHWGTKSGQFDAGGGLDFWLPSGLATLDVGVPRDEDAVGAALDADDGGAAWDDVAGGAARDEEAGGCGDFAGLQSKLTW